MIIKSKLVLFLFLVFALLLVPLAGALDPEIEKNIKSYTLASEQVTYVELTNGRVTTDIVIKIGDSPVMVLDRFGRAVTDEAKIREVVTDYITSANSPLNVGQTITSVISETTTRVNHAALLNSADYAESELNQSASKIRASSQTLGALSSFATANSLQAQLSQEIQAMRTSNTFLEGQLKNDSFNSKYARYKLFADSVERNTVRITSILEAQKQARESLNQKTTSAGRNNPKVVQAQTDLAKLQEEVRNIQNKLNAMEPIDDTFTANLYQKSSKLLQDVNAIEGGAQRGLFDWIPAIAVILLLIIGLALYLKRIKDKQHQDEAAEREEMQAESSTESNEPNQE